MPIDGTHLSQDPTYHCMGKVQISLNADQLENVIDGLYSIGWNEALANHLRDLYRKEYPHHLDHPEKWDVPPVPPSEPFGYDTRADEARRHPDGIHVRLTDEDKKAVDDYVAKLDAQIDAADARGMALVINANGKPMFVPKEEAYRYNGNDDMGSRVFGCPNCHSVKIVDGTQPGEHHCMTRGINIDLGGINLDLGEDTTTLDDIKDDDLNVDDLAKMPDPLVPCYDGGQEFLIRKSTAEDWERGEEFEKAAEAAANPQAEETHIDPVCEKCGRKLV